MLLCCGAADPRYLSHQALKNIVHKPTKQLFTSQKNHFDGHLVCFPCFINGNQQCIRRFYSFQESFDWHCTLGASAIASTAFALGWDLQALRIVSDFSDEIALRERNPRKQHNMLWFLRCIERQVLARQDAEVRFWLAASVALSRWGVKSDTQPLIMPGRTRYGGVPLALMPRCIVW